jgi:hypothetical protein
MDRIVLTSSRAELELSGRVFAVVAPGYEAPVGVDVVPLAKLLAAPARWLGEPGTMVAVGLARMMTAANRVALGKVFLRPREGLRRIVVDRTLFISEPWRAWWPFRAAGEALPFGLTDSFLAETRWRMALETQSACPFGIEPVRAAMRGIVRGVDPFRFDEPSVEILPVSASARAEYARIKEAAFTDEKTIGAILAKLSAFAKSVEPRRAIPSTANLFKSATVRIVRTDLAVDAFLAEQLLDRVALTNAIAEASLA